MPANRNALIRYKTIDTCLQNRHRKWTLEDLIESVSEALYEYEGIHKGISKRSIQADIQMMRSEKLGYEAPIVVIDKKYYTYEDPNFSITKTPLTSADVSRMNEALDMLKQFKGFSHFNQLSEVINKLEEHIYSNKEKRNSVIDFEKNENLKGLEYLDDIYQSILQKKAIFLNYQSFKARKANQFYFHVWWLKEFKNRWFAVGVRHKHDIITTLALDRILDLKIDADAPYIENLKYSPELYYYHVIGATVSHNMRASKVRIKVSNLHAPYIETKPLHHSQQVVERSNTGIIIEIKVQLNFELEKELLGFGEGLEVLEPPALRKIIQKRLALANEQYR
ncbi:WYL domain-containing protein [Arcicella sp. DC2W]|uniref:WYL domain-containing protein n=1 Tax=Arcicella gelida TaxID=2984195 RepID=A0ABU5S734_9BACT|nr:WYL domain-containing protein [Arcicella sp. DC2W]MEA5404284.1 WYL domain-containing protein [Arcicella sp. DC2W]